MEAWTKQLTWSSLSTAGYQLRQLRPVVRCLSDDATKTLVDAFIASRLDYCNASFFGITNELLCRLQSVAYRTLLPGW